MTRPWTAADLAAYNAKREAKIKALRERGYPVPVIAAKMGISRARVYQILARP